MLLLKTKISILFLLVFVGQIKAQTIVVKDTLFAKELCNDFPLAMDPTCRLLDTIVARANYSTAPIEFRAFNLGITDATELKYFSGIDSLYLNRNKLQSFIPLSNFPELRRLHIPFNNLTQAPEINYANSKLNLVFIQDNQITDLPEGWKLPNTNINGINISNNLLTSVPDFEGYLNMALLYVFGNSLSFSHLVPLKKHPKYNETNWKLFPQKAFFITDDLEVIPNKTVSISVKDKTGGNSYFLYHNGVLKDSNTVGDFPLLITGESESGTYKVIVKNELFTKPSQILESQEFNISVNYPSQFKEKDVLLFSPNGDGIGDELYIDGEGICTVYDASGKEIIVGNLPFIWNGRSSTGIKANPGMYYIKTDARFYKALLSF